MSDDNFTWDGITIDSADLTHSELQQIWSAVHNLEGNDMAHDPYSAVHLVEDLIGAREGKTNELLHNLTREDTESEVVVDEIVGRIKSIELLIRWLKAEQSTLTTALEMRELRDQPLADTLAQLREGG